MRHVKYILLILFLFININVHANACSYQEQTTLNNDFSNIKISYEIKNDNEINILIYNLTENIFISYIDPITNEENSIYYYNSNDAKYFITRNAENVEEYKFVIKSNITSCYGKILTTKILTKPAYNPYSKLEICENEKLKNHSYCQKYITKKITKNQDEVIKTLEEFIENRVERMTTKPVLEEKKNSNIKNIIIYSSVAITLITIATISIIIYKKRGEL